MLTKIEDAMATGQGMEACRLAQRLIAATGDAHARKVLVAQLDKLCVNRTLRAPDNINSRARNLWELLRRGGLSNNEIEAAKAWDAHQVLLRRHLIKQYRFRWVLV